MRAAFSRDHQLSPPLSSSSRYPCPTTSTNSDTSRTDICIPPGWRPGRPLPRAVRPCPGRGCRRTLAVEGRDDAAMERLTAEDQIMLWPDALWPQEIGAL